MCSSWVKGGSHQKEIFNNKQINRMQNVINCIELQFSKLQKK